jgi:hypothetical protein
MFVQDENSDRWQQSYEMQTQFPERTLCRTFNILTELILEWELHDSMKYSIIEHNEPKWMFLQIEGRNPMKCRLNSQSETLCMAFNLVTKLLLEWELHDSMKYSIKEHYKPKWMNYKPKTIRNHKLSKVAGYKLTYRNQ